MRRISFSCALLFAALLSAQDGFAEAPQAKPVKNVIMMVPDGTSVPCYALARWWRGGAPLNLDPYACGLVRTYSASSIITDSAASATAYATGRKTTNYYVSVSPSEVSSPGLEKPQPGETPRPMPTVAELARLSGRSVGIVATCHIVDATPAAFSSHSTNRKSWDDIFEQQAHSGFDVILGGGTKFLNAASRADKEDMAAAIRDQGFELVTGKAGLDAAKSKRIFGLFGSHAMAYDLDRDPALEPSLAEMTKKAIATLSSNEKGFFLLVEGSKVDWGAHANNPAGIVSELSAFDDAFKVALDFAKADGDTAIAVCADHGNSGISFGDRSAGSGNLDVFMKCLKKVKRTPEGLQKILAANPSPEAVKAKISELYGIDDLTQKELDAIVKAIPGSNFVEAVSAPMKARSHVGFTTGGHTGEEVALFCFAPGPRPGGVIENTDVNRWLRAWASLPAPEESPDALFAELKPLFEASGAKVSENLSDPANPVLNVEKGGRKLRLPVNRNYALLDGVKTRLPGVVVRIEGKWYAPAKLTELLK